MAAGVTWISNADTPLSLALVVIALALGFLKARFVFARSARKIVDRIERRGDGRCIGGFLSWKTWLLVIAMVALGRVLRASSIPLTIRGTVYAVIGAALFTASRQLWARWRIARVSQDP